MGVTIRLNLAFDPSLLRILNYYLENSEIDDWHFTVRNHIPRRGKKKRRETTTRSTIKVNIHMGSAKTCGGPSQRRFVGLYFKVDETNNLEIFT